MAAEFPQPISAPQLVDSVHENTVFDHAVAVSKQGKSPGDLWCPRCVAIHPATNNIYVAEGARSSKFARVSIFSETGEFLKSYTHEHMESLHGIAIHRDNLYVTDWALHVVFHIKMGLEFRLVDKIGSSGSDIGQFGSPRQLTISINGDLYVADSDNHRIQVLDSSLHPIRAIKHPSMHKPLDIKLSTDEMYVLCNEGKYCVLVFSYTGHKIRSLLTRGKGMQVERPCCLYVDANKNIFITDNKEIKIFSNEGTILHTIGQPGHVIGMFGGPKGLALTSDLKLVTASSSENHRLQIFSFM